MHVRVASYDVPQERLDEAVENFREAAKKIEELEGLQGGYVLVDENGRVVTITFWESLLALEATETRASVIRQGAVQAVSGQVRSVESFEVSAELAPVARAER